jgi:hypothetical protein
MKHFETLNTINVNEKTEKKNGLTYLSWAWAWSEIKKIYPDALYHILRFENNLPYVYDEGVGFMVFTDVTIENVTHEMWLPVMDGANKAMTKEPYTYEVAEYGWDEKLHKKVKTGTVEKTCEAATMFDVNKTIMRCLTKNLAMFGLGLYIYAGEDLPEEIKTPEEIAAEEEARKTALEKIPQVSIDALNLLLARKGVKIDLKKYKLAKIEDMTKGTYLNVVGELNKLPDKEKVVK